MPVCHKRKLAFCHIPRTGGVSIARALNMKVEDKHEPASFFRKHYPGYTLFATLRNESDRVNSSHGWQSFTNNGNHGLMTKPNDYFLDCKVDYLLRFDHLEEDLNNMLHALGIKKVKLQHCNSFMGINIVSAIQAANKNSSKIDSYLMKELQGLSSPKVRHLLNNLAAQAKSYLEIGCYLGGTLRAALHSNEHLYAVAVDNFCMKPQTRQNFFDNTSMLKFEFFEQDSFTVDLSKITQPIELYFYDGDHSFEATQKAIEYYYDVLADEFVLVVDDWNAKRIPNAIFTIAQQLNLKVVENYDLMSAPKGEWWNGLGVIKFSKHA